MNTTQTIQLTTEFQTYFATMIKESWGTWTSEKDWPTCGTGYTVAQHEEGVIIKFDSTVKNVEGQTGKRFKIYPVSGRKPNGLFSALRS